VTQATIEPVVREITDEEVAHYRENGWVSLERLIEPELAQALLEAAKDVMGESPSASGQTEQVGGRSVKRGGKVTDAGFWQDFHFIGRDEGVEPFRSLIYSKEIGHAVQRLLARDVGVRYHLDLVACKMPAGQAGGAPTAWHQDYPVFPMDRVGTTQIWIALNDLTPAHGTMRFLSGSQREGSLGRTIAARQELFDVYSWLTEKYEWSPPLSMKAGDATAHDGNVIHGAPANETGEPRWGFITGYMPADCLYTGAPYHNFDNLGLEVNKPFDHPRCPVVYP
jgi:ectoine hydroxylase-related dioxygenase (phytanoyl-CoA dioxygenase family)